MTRKLRIYLDTSVFSAFYDERTPERQRLTQEFWAKLSEYEKLRSQLTLDELARVSDSALRERLLELAQGVHVLAITLEPPALSAAQHAVVGELCQCEAWTAALRDLGATGGVALCSIWRD